MAFHAQQASQLRLFRKFMMGNEVHVKSKQVGGNNKGTEKERYMSCDVESEAWHKQTTHRTPGDKHSVGQNLAVAVKQGKRRGAYPWQNPG